MMIVHLSFRGMESKDTLMAMQVEQVLSLGMPGDLSDGVNSIDSFDHWVGCRFKQ